MDRCGICGKTLQGDDVAMYDVDAGSLGRFEHIKRVPCCIPCVEKERRKIIENNRASIRTILTVLTVAGLAFGLFFLLAFFFV